MNRFKLKAKGVPLNSMDSENTDSDSCSDNEELFEFDDSIDF